MHVHQLAAKYRNDPTGSIKWEKKYANGIIPLINNFKGRIIRDFNHAWETGEIRKLEAGKFDPSKFYQHIENVAREEIEEPAKKAIQKIIPKAYDQGFAFGSIRLGAPLEVRQGEWKKISDLIQKNEYEIKGLSDRTAQEVRRIIGDNIIDEKPQGKIVKEIQECTERSESDAIRIARTETQKAVNAGVKDRYRRAGIEVVEWLAAGDDRCCNDCEDLDGKQWPIEQAPPCPKHPNCRCTIIPVVRPDWENVRDPWIE